MLQNKAKKDANPKESDDSNREVRNVNIIMYENVKSKSHEDELKQLSKSLKISNQNYKKNQLFLPLETPKTPFNTPIFNANNNNQPMPIDPITL